MAVITIRGSLGSGASEIGRMVAEKLNIDYLDREIIAEVASRIVWTESAVEAKEMPTGSFIERIGEALKYAYASGAGVDGIYRPTWQIQLDDDRYVSGLQSVIKELAENGSVVILGRGSQFILKDMPSAFHVLTVAPQELRVKRVSGSTGADEEAVRKEIERYDNSRRNRISSKRTTVTSRFHNIHNFIVRQNRTHGINTTT